MTKKIELIIDFPANDKTPAARAHSLLGQNRGKGTFKYYVTQMGVGVSDFPEKKRYEGVMFNVISVTRVWVGVQFPGK